MMNKTHECSPFCERPECIHARFPEDVAQILTDPKASTSDLRAIVFHQQAQIEALNAKLTEAIATPATPRATLVMNGEPDPHGDRYNCARADLCMGNLRIRWLSRRPDKVERPEQQPQEPVARILRIGINGIRIVWIRGADPQEGEFGQFLYLAPPKTDAGIPESTVSALRFVVAHWREFGPEHGFDEAIELAARVLPADAGAAGKD